MAGFKKLEILARGFASVYLSLRPDLKLILLSNHTCGSTLGHICMLQRLNMYRYTVDSMRCALVSEYTWGLHEPCLSLYNLDFRFRFLVYVKYSLGVKGIS